MTCCLDATKALLGKMLLPVLFLFLTGCGEQAPPPPKLSGPAVPAYGDAYVEGSLGDASNLIPYLASDTTSSGITGNVYDGLLRFDKNLDLVPNLAESWEISEDGLTITFKLRQGVKWHDGQPFTAEDCVFTWKFVTDPQTPTPYAADMLQIETAEALDPHTFRVRYKRPFSKALYLWLGDIVPKHLLEGQNLADSPLARHPIGTGPYVFVSWKPGASIELKSNPEYFRGRPYIDRVVSKIIPDTATMFLELKAGNIDSMVLTPIQYARQTGSEKFKAAFNKYRYVASSYTYLGYNLRNKLFQDRKVRLALGLAINREELVQGVLLGYGKPAVGGFKPGTWAANPEIEPIPYDPEKAKRLLAQAGWIDSDGDGVLDRGGVPFSFTIVTNQGNSARLKTAIIIQEWFKRIGVQVKVRAVEWAALLKEFIDKQAFEATIMGWTQPADPDPFVVWHSSKVEPGGLNFIGFKNREVDELIVTARETVDREVRRKAYFRFQEIIHHEQPYSFLYQPETLPVVSSRFYGIEPAVAGIAYNFNQWFVPRELQKYSYAP